MQIEISLVAEQPGPEGSGYAASDLGFLLHKNPARLHEREISAGKASVFYSEVGARRTTAILHLDIDPIALVRGRGEQSGGLLAQYVNNRPYVANSFLSVAMSRTFGQTFSGKSKERQDLADRALPFEARVTPVAVAGDAETIARLFGPLGYEIDAALIEGGGGRGLFDLRLKTTARLQDVLSHLYVLTPVLDNAKHYWIDREEIAKLIDKGEGWLPGHPEKQLIASRALKHRRSLVNAALERLAPPEEAQQEEEADAETPAKPASAAEETLEKPLRLHELRLDAVASEIEKRSVASVLDLGCGEGRLLRRLLQMRGVTRILGVDPATRSLQRAADRLRLETAGQAVRERLQLQPGSLTYGDKRWRGFDAATLVEVIEHIDPPRLSSLALSVFGDARPRVVIVTTPNREYNALFEGMAPDARRHSDHRFEWTRAEFETWCASVGDAFGYAARCSPLGPLDERLGAPSQMAVFTRAPADG